MQNILTDLSESALITAIRANMLDFFRYLVRKNPGDCIEDKNFIRWHTRIPFPWYNGIAFSTPLDAKNEETIAASIEYFNNKKVNHFTCWFAPELNAKDWEPVLKKYGFIFSNDVPGMAIDLAQLDTSRQTLRRLETHIVEDEAALRSWTNIFIPAYGLPASWESPLFEMMLTFGFDLPTRNYLAYLDGKPVATSSMVIGGGVAGIYNVATLPEARSQGIGAILTAAPLAEAKQMGYRAGILQSSDMGFKVYQKLGFKHLCQIEYFQHGE